MAYERLRTATRLATAALVVVGCRFGFDDVPPGDGGVEVEVDAEPPCTPAVAIVDIDAGHDFMCAKLADNSMRCWGANDTGQLGSSTRTTIAGSSVTPTGLPDVSTFSTGYQHTCAVRAGDVWCWGRNDIGQLGQNDRVGRAIPTRVNGLPSDMVGVAAGGLSTCAWNASGALYCWGQHSGTNTNPSNIPRLVAGVPPVQQVVMSSARAFFSEDHACALGTDSSTWCWGDNSLYQLGNNTTVDSSTPVAVTAPGFASLAAGSGHTCGRTTTGEVHCWGLNVDGQGTGPMNRLMTPTLVTGLVAEEIDAKGENTCARLPNGDVVCFGDNDFRQLGRDGGDAFAPERIPIAPARRIAVGTLTSCALGTDGVLRCWGPERSGVITGAIAPPTTTLLSDVVQIDASGDNTCARLGDGRLFCWGAGALGQLGTGVSQAPTADPTQIPLPLAATWVSVGILHACATLADGSVRCWGFNEGKQVDQDNALVRPTVAPAGVPASNGVAAGAGHTCAYSTTTTDPWCWGGNAEGALGLPNSNPGIAPQESNFPLMRFMDAGRNHTCGITPSPADDLVCAGRNNEGQIGDGATTDTYAPYQHPFTESVIALATGDHHTCVATSAPNTVWCWGDHIGGQLGLGSEVNSNVPAAVTLAGNVVQLAAGRAHTCSRDDAGTVRCWGANTDGQLGDGSLSSVATPTVATELAGATQITAGSRHTCGLMPNGAIRCVGANEVGQLGGSAAVPSAAPRQAVFTCPR